MPSKPFLSVVISVRNNGERLALLLIDVDRYLSAQKFSYEIIVINNNSYDKTGEIARKFEPLMKNLNLIELDTNRSQKELVKLALAEARGKWRLVADINNFSAAVDLDRMLPYLKRGSDLIVGRHSVFKLALICFSETMPQQLAEERDYKIKEVYLGQNLVDYSKVLCQNFIIRKWLKNIT